MEEEGVKRIHQEASTMLKASREVKKDKVRPVVLATGVRLTLTRVTLKLSGRQKLFSPEWLGHKEEETSHADRASKGLVRRVGMKLDYWVRGSNTRKGIFRIRVDV